MTRSYTYLLERVRWGRTGQVWVLCDGSPAQGVIKTWYAAPLAVARAWCVLHGYGWPTVRR